MFLLFNCHRRIVRLIKLWHILGLNCVEVLLQVAQNEFERSFRPDEVRHGRVVLHEAHGVLVDGVVGQMHLHVAHVVVGGLRVGSGGEPGQAILEKKYSQRLDAKNQHIEAEVELHPVDQKRLVDVLLDYAMTVLVG